MASSMTLLTISDLIAVVCLCATFFSLGYSVGKRANDIQ